MGDASVKSVRSGNAMAATCLHVLILFENISAKIRVVSVQGVRIGDFQFLFHLRHSGGYRAANEFSIVCLSQHTGFLV